jgi:hypothetical protein
LRLASAADYCLGAPNNSLIFGPNQGGSAGSAEDLHGDNIIMLYCHSCELGISQSYKLLVFPTLPTCPSQFITAFLLASIRIRLRLCVTMVAGTFYLILLRLPRPSEMHLHHRRKQRWGRRHLPFEKDDIYLGPENLLFPSASRGKSHHRTAMD